MHSRRHRENVGKKTRNKNEREKKQEEGPRAAEVAKLQEQRHSS